MTNTEQIGLVNITLQYLAEIYVRFFAPVAIDRTLEIGGRRVRVRVWSVEREPETELDALMSEAHGAHD